MKRILCVALVVAMLASLLVLPAHAVREDTVIQTVGLLGIMNGDTSGNLNLSKSVTRAEFAKMVIKASPQRELTGDSSASAPFPDVRGSHWASGYVFAAVQNGWINGYLDGRFRPENPVKMEEAVNIVLKLLGYRDADFLGTYPTAQINQYRALGLDENVSCMQGGDMSRRDCMYLLYNALNATNKEDYLALVRPKFGIASFDAMLAFAKDCTAYVPNVYMTVVDVVTSPEEQQICRRICESVGAVLRVRPYEEN